METAVEIFKRILRHFIVCFFFVLFKYNIFP